MIQIEKQAVNKKSTRLYGRHRRDFNFVKKQQQKRHEQRQVKNLWRFRIARLEFVIRYRYDLEGSEYR